MITVPNGYCGILHHYVVAGSFRVSLLITTGGGLHSFLGKGTQHALAVL